MFFFLCIATQSQKPINSNYKNLNLIFGYAEIMIRNRKIKYNTYIFDDITILYISFVSILNRSFLRKHTIIDPQL